MELEAKAKAKIGFLNEEMDALHFADRLYWDQGHFHTPAASAKYQFRQDRLEVIRTELAKLRSELKLPEA